MTSYMKLIIVKKYVWSKNVAKELEDLKYLGTIIFVND